MTDQHLTDADDLPRDDELTASAEDLFDEEAAQADADVTDDQVDLDADDVNALDLPAAPQAPLDVRHIRIDDIAERTNIRKTHGIKPLAETMHLDGQLQACLVRPAPADAEHGKPFELIFGHRRKMAAELLGWDELRCEVRDVPDADRIVQMFVENYQRENLSAVEEAYTMLELKEEKGWSQARIARELGCDASHVSHRLKLLSLATPAPITPPAAPVPAEPAADADGSVSAPADAGNDGWGDEPSDASAQLPVPAAPPAEPDKKRVDILALVDEGKLSASAAEVVASMDNRDEQEKVAGLASRYGWSVKQVEKYVRKMKEHEIVEGPDEMGPVEMVVMDDAVELPRLPLRALTDEDYSKIELFALLRNGMDAEMLEYLQEVMGYAYDYLWSYVEALTHPQRVELTQLLLRRYISAAHRFHDLPPELVDEMSLPQGATDDETAQALDAAKLTLPGAFENPDPLPAAQ